MLQLPCALTSVSCLRCNPRDPSTPSTPSNVEARTPGRQRLLESTKSHLSARPETAAQALRSATLTTHASWLKRKQKRLRSKKTVAIYCSPHFYYQLEPPTWKTTTADRLLSSLIHGSICLRTGSEASTPVTPRLPPLPQIVQKNREKEVWRALLRRRPTARRQPTEPDHRASFPWYALSTSTMRAVLKSRNGLACQRAATRPPSTTGLCCRLWP